MLYTHIYIHILCEFTQFLPITSLSYLYLKGTVHTSLITYLLTFMSFQTCMLLLFPWDLYTAVFQTNLERAKNIRTPLKFHERAVQKQLGFFTHDYTSNFSVQVMCIITGPVVWSLRIIYFSFIMSYACAAR